MRIEVLHIDDCPNWRQAVTRVQAALSTTAVPDVTVTTRLLTTTAEASEVPFAGSPTILIDGTDAFPSDGRTTDLACRIYRTASGFAGLPSVDDITDAIRARIEARS